MPKSVQVELMVFTSRQCPFCKSMDTDRPYKRPARIALLSILIPRLRRHFCRSCGRHFWILLRRIDGDRAEGR